MRNIYLEPLLEGRLDGRLEGRLDGRLFLGEPPFGVEDMAKSAPEVFCLRFQLGQEPRTIFKAKIKNYLPKNQDPLDQEPRTT